MLFSLCVYGVLLLYVLMLLMLAFALLFFPSLAEEELQGVKQKYAGSSRHTKSIV